MNLRFRLCLCAILMSTGFNGFAQGFVENALLFSRTKPGGSARVQAMGGAQIALGGDFSSALSNPAGLGMYNRSEVTFSPALNVYNTDAEHNGTTTADSKNVFNIPGLSIVFNIPRENDGFLGGSFGVSMTRINDFNTTFQYSGVDDVSSIVDYFKERATGYTIDPLPSPYANTPLLDFNFPEGLAYLTYLITPFNEDPDNTNPSLPDDYINYFSDLDTLWNGNNEEIRTLNRSQQVNVKGAQYQWSLAYGGNFNDKLFFGASLGITTLRYSFKSSYTESDFSFSQTAGYDPLDNLNLNEDIVIDGTGLNLTAGLIYRPVDFMQIGVSVVTPTLYNLSDSYGARLQTDWNASVGYGDQDEASEPILADYNFTTPFKFSSGVAFFLGKYGFVTGDVEFINYNQAKYDSETEDVSMGPENEDIKFYYTNVVNYRVGAELRYDIFRFRGGYSVQANPYKENFDIDRTIKTVSAGAGVRLSQFYVDAAWLMSKNDSCYSPYVFQNGTGPVASLQNNMNSVMLTFGLTF
jgi:hypothetical protein